MRIGKIRLGKHFLLAMILGGLALIIIFYGYSFITQAEKSATLYEDNIFVQSKSYSSLVPIKDFTVSLDEPTILRIEYTFKKASNLYPESRVAAQIWRNGQAYGPIHTAVYTEDFIHFSEELMFNDGDLIELRVRTTAGAVAVQNDEFKISLA